MSPRTTFLTVRSSVAGLEWRERVDEAEAGLLAGIMMLDAVNHLLKMAG